MCKMLLTACVFKNDTHDIFLGLPECDAPAAHRIFCDRHGLIETVLHASLGCATPGEGGDMLILESGTEYIHTYADNRSGVEHGRNSRFGVVAHHQPAEKQAGVGQHIGSIAMQLDIRVVVFQIRIVGIRAKVTPFSQHRVPQVAIVALVTISENHTIAHFAAHFG